MRDGWKSRWGWRVSAVVLVGGLLVLGTGNVVTQAGERDDDHDRRNPFQQILNKLDKILDVIKGGGGQDGNHTLRWDQNLPAAQRFVVLAAFNNAAVLDHETGLVWEQAPDTTPGDWFTARRTCINKNVWGRKGWRLPSSPELARLIDPSVASPGPTIPAGHPFSNVQQADNWSATTNAENASNAWVVQFSNGNVSNSVKTVTFRVWCVRGGMNADQY